MEKSSNFELCLDAEALYKTSFVQPKNGAHCNRQLQTILLKPLQMHVIVRIEQVFACYISFRLTL